MTRIGLIGSGNISATHAKAIGEIPDATIVAVYGPTLSRARALAESFGARAYDDLDAMLTSESLDMVAIGTPSGLHGEHAAAAARRGVHILVEKPLEIAVDRCDALMAEARRANVTLGVVFQDRLKPDLRTLKTRLDAGELGTPRIVRAEIPWWRPPEYYRDSRWRGTLALDGGGALMNQGIHTVDLVQWLCGPVIRVYGRTSSQCHAIEVEDTAVAVLEFAGGAIGTLFATTCAYPGRPRRVEIIGSKATALLEGDRLDPSDAARPENVASPVVSDVSAHRDVIADFITAFTRGIAPSCSGEEGRRSVQVIEAIYASSLSGKPVEIAGA
jgi:predicted dehydrogenase